MWYRPSNRSTNYHIKNINEYRNPDIALVGRLFKDLAAIEIVFKRDLEPLGEAIIKVTNSMADPFA